MRRPWLAPLARGSVLRQREAVPSTGSEAEPCAHPCREDQVLLVAVVPRMGRPERRGPHSSDRLADHRAVPELLAREVHLDPDERRFHMCASTRSPSRWTSAARISPPKKSWTTSDVMSHWPRLGLSGVHPSSSSAVSRLQL